jgi:hypothetical protein
MPFSQNGIDLDWLIWKPKTLLKSYKFVLVVSHPPEKLLLQS